MHSFSIEWDQDGQLKVEPNEVVPLTDPTAISSKSTSARHRRRRAWVAAATVSFQVASIIPSVVTLN